MKKVNIKKFVKDHKKEIVICASAIGAGIVGFTLGKSFGARVASGKKYVDIFETNDDFMHEMLTALKASRDSGEGTFLSHDIPYKLSELGDLGCDMLDAAHDEGYEINNVIIF